MDRFNKSFSLIFLFISFSSFAQYDSSYIEKKIIDGKYTIVSMSVERFTEYYKARKNLELIKQKLSIIEAKIDSLEKINDSIEKKYDSQISSLKEQKELLLNDSKECVNLVEELKEKNIKLEKKNNKLKSQRNIFIGTTIISVIVMSILIVLGG